MCECAIHTPQKKHNWFGEKKFRLADFFDQWWDIYCQDPKHLFNLSSIKQLLISELAELLLWELTITRAPSVETLQKYTTTVKTDSVQHAVGVIQCDGLKK